MEGSRALMDRLQTGPSLFEHLKPAHEIGPVHREAEILRFIINIFDSKKNISPHIENGEKSRDSLPACSQSGRAPLDEANTVAGHQSAVRGNGRLVICGTMGHISTLTNISHRPTPNIDICNTYLRQMPPVSSYRP
jgi:hypothetical protein